MKNRIPSVLLAGALLAFGSAATACNVEVGHCPEPKPVAADPVALSLVPSVTWLDPGTLEAAPRRAGYGRLSFRLLNPRDNTPLGAELTPDTREFADRSFLGWLGSFYNDTEQTYMLSVEVVEFADGEVKVLHRRPVYAYTSRETFSSISDNQMIDFGGEIGAKKSSAQITVHYTPEELVGRQVAAVVNFPPRQIGRFMSEVLTLGLPAADGSVVLIAPTKPVPNGGKLF